jgi:hypothetical protein
MLDHLVIGPVHQRRVVDDAPRQCRRADVVAGDVADLILAGDGALGGGLDEVALDPLADIGAALL